MDFNELKKEDILKIKKIKYQIIENWDEGFDELPYGKDRWYSICEMIEVKSGKITPTHTLIYYRDGKDIFIINKVNKKKTKLKKEDFILL